MVKVNDIDVEVQFMRKLRSEKSVSLLKVQNPFQNSYIASSNVTTIVEEAY